MRPLAAVAVLLASSAAAQEPIDTARIEHHPAAKSSPDAKEGAGDTSTVKRADPADVVFVCEHGSVKSVIAAEWFNRLAREHGTSLRAVARGVTPDASVPAPVAAALAQDGFDVGAFHPQAFDEREGGRRVVAFGIDVATEAPRERWDGVPPASERYAEASQDIRRRVDDLYGKLAAAP
jgi:arsenate reductase